MIGIIDYDAGNLKSVEKALLSLNEECVVTRDPEVIYQADKIILPGVGSFGDAMGKLHQYELVEVLRNCVAQGKPLLGICLGLQLLFESSDETPGVEGLGILPGKIVKLPDTAGLKIPHMGWNSLNFPKKSKLFANIASGSYVYFVHSYYLQAENFMDVAAVTQYATEIHAAVEHENVFACQFHPEKSGQIGLKILKNFAEC